MNLILSALLIFLWLFTPQSVIVASGQGQNTNVKVLERGDDWQCPSMEERETMRNEIHQIANSAILKCNWPHSHLQWYTRMEACCFYQYD